MAPWLCCAALTCFSRECFCTSVGSWVQGELGCRVLSPQGKVVLWGLRAAVFILHGPILLLEVLQHHPSTEK